MAIHPRILYRYRALSGPAIEYVENTILRGEIYFSKPSAFNDPFDCRPSFSFDASDSEILAYYTRVARKAGTGLAFLGAADLAQQKLYDRKNGPRSIRAREELQSLHTEMVADKIGVLCLSEVRDSILMRGHYANNHTGLCLGFDGRHSFFTNAHPVNYVSTRPIVNPFRQTSEEMLDAAIFSKAAEWSYEKEWRQLRYKEGAGLATIPLDALSVVILGCRAEPDSQEKVIGWLRLRKLKPRLLRAVPYGHNYSLQFKVVSY